jgi:hypothetical protein
MKLIPFEDEIRTIMYKWRNDMNAGGGVKGTGLSPFHVEELWLRIKPVLSRGELPEVAGKQEGFEEWCNKQMCSEDNASKSATCLRCRIAYNAALSPAPKQEGFEKIDRAKLPEEIVSDMIDILGWNMSAEEVAMAVGVVLQRLNKNAALASTDREKVALDMREAIYKSFNILYPNDFPRESRDTFATKVIEIYDKIQSRLSVREGK